MGPTGATSTLNLTVIEQDLGSLLRYSGTFDIAGLSGLSAGTSVLVVQLAGAYTGKGDRYDEVEDDMVTATGVAVDATTIRVFWQSVEAPVSGNIRFGYSVSNAGTVLAVGLRRFAVGGIEPANAVSGFTAQSDASSPTPGYRGYAQAVVQNSTIDYELLLESGTWSFTITSPKNNNAAIISTLMKLDGGAFGATVADFDLYNAGLTYDNISTVTGIVIATTGRYTIRLTNATKNASSSDFSAYFAMFVGARTGA